MTESISTIAHATGGTVEDVVSLFAHLEEHNYNGFTPKAFYIVVCDVCLVALNSGHHYTDDVKHFAVALADQHNEQEHGVYRD